MKHLIPIVIIALLVSCSPTQTKETSALPDPVKYEANWTSLHQHNTPEWLYGMKFGIYCHWGPQTVQVASGNKDMTMLEAIDQWNGENFDAKAWVDLFQGAGAQFGGPVAWHGSGLVNWDSDITEWNAVKKGPHTDIYGSLARELRKRGMPVISSFHTGDFWSRMWGPISKENTTCLDPAQDNSKYATSNKGRIDTIIFDAWFARISEAITKYQPDIVWFDTGFGGTIKGDLHGSAEKGRLLPDGDNTLVSTPEKYQQKLISYYFNKAQQWGKEVEVTYKTFDIPPGIGMRDIENGNLVGLQYDSWMADINMQNHYDWRATWFYNPKNKPKDAGTLIDMLIDITSKNGRILLNVPPKADGTFADEIKHELYAMGDWLKINGEAIYNTMPWIFFGEGPTEIKNVGHHAQGKNHGNDIPVYTAQDIRFTQNGKNLYAICLDWPGDELTIRTLGSRGKLYPGEIKNVSLLGCSEKIKWEQKEEGMVVQFPKERPCDFAYVIKIERN